MQYNCSTYYSLPIREDVLPDPIEDKLVQYAKRMRMRRTQGEYPFVRFSRRLLNYLCDRKGSARLSTAHPDDAGHQRPSTKRFQGSPSGSQPAEGLDGNLPSQERLLPLPPDRRGDDSYQDAGVGRQLTGQFRLLAAANNRLVECANSFRDQVKDDPGPPVCGTRPPVAPNLLRRSQEVNKDFPPLATVTAVTEVEANAAILVIKRGDGY